MRIIMSSITKYNIDNISFPVECLVVEDQSFTSFLTFLICLICCMLTRKFVQPQWKQKKCFEEAFLWRFFYLSAFVKNTYRGFQKINPQISIITPKLFDLHGCKPVQHGSLCKGQKALHSDLSVWCVLLKKKS